MKRYCKSLREHAIKIISFKKEKHEIINKRRAGIRRKCKKIVIFVKKNVEINI